MTNPRGVCVLKILSMMLRVRGRARDRVSGNAEQLLEIPWGGRATSLSFSPPLTLLPFSKRANLYKGDTEANEPRNVVRLSKTRGNNPDVLVSTFHASVAGGA